MLYSVTGVFLFFCRCWMANNGFLNALINHHCYIYLLLQITVHHKGVTIHLVLSIFSYKHCMWIFMGTSDCQRSLQIHLLPSYESVTAAFVAASKVATVFVPFRPNGNCTLLDPYRSEAADPCGGFSCKVLRASGTARMMLSSCTCA